jgi:hypothetical protein
VDATPVDPSIGLPELQNLPINADSISTYAPPDGGTCHIMFLNGVPTAPICVWTSSPPSHANILNGDTPAAKLGDTTQSYITGGIAVQAATLLAASAGPTFTITIAAPFIPGVPNPCVIAGQITILPGSVLAVVQGLNPLSGKITTGSSLLSVPGT